MNKEKMNLDFNYDLSIKFSLYYAYKRKIQKRIKQAYSKSEKNDLIRLIGCE